MVLNIAIYGRTWTYTASFRTGSDVATSSSASAGSATAFDGATGTFNISATNKSAPDNRAKGMLRVVNKHYLQWAETGETIELGLGTDCVWAEDSC